LSIAWEVVDAFEKMASAAQQRPVIACGFLSRIALPLRRLPHVKSAIHKAAFTEIVLKMRFGYLSGNDGHAAAHQAVDFIAFDCQYISKFFKSHKKTV